jgi:hypothetical protein
MISTAVAAENASLAVAPERRERQDDHDGDEDGGHAVGEPLHRRSAALGLAHEPGDPRRRRVGADPRRADHEPPADVDRRARDRRPRPHLDRHRLAGQHAPVDRALALLDDAVGGELLAGPDHEAVPDDQSVGRNTVLAAVGVEHRGVLGGELEQRTQRRTRAALGARLEVAAGEDERDHDRRRLEIHVTAGGERVQRPGEAGQRADADQRVHRRGAVAEAGPRGAMERISAPQDDRRREREREQPPAPELQRGRHREHQQGKRQRRRDDQSRGRRPAGRQRRGVAGLLDRRDELLRLDGRRIELDRRLLRRVVDARADALEPVQPALHPNGAGRAGHAFDGQLEPRRHIPAEGIRRCHERAKRKPVGSSSSRPVTGTPVRRPKLAVSRPPGHRG